MFDGFLSHAVMLLAFTSWNFVGLYIDRNTRTVQCYSPKLQSGEKYKCFVISRVCVIYQVWVIFISTVKISHLSVSLSSFQDFDQSGHRFWIIRFHSIMLSITTHTHDVAVVKSPRQITVKWQPGHHRGIASVGDTGLYQWNFTMLQSVFFDDVWSFADNMLML